jgi:hypothetical protein
MPTGPYYRGGSSLSPRRLEDVREDKRTKRLKTTHGVSVYDRPDHPRLAQHGGASQVGDIPDRLRIVKRGADPSHYEIAPAVEMMFEEYEELLKQITLSRVEPDN